MTSGLVRKSALLHMQGWTGLSKIIKFSYLVFGSAILKDFNNFSQKNSKSYIFEAALESLEDLDGSK